MNYLSVEGLSKSWNEKVLFDQITFGLSRGEKVALIAGNGSGKSSLMNILAGNDKPMLEILVFGKISIGSICLKIRL